VFVNSSRITDNDREADESEEGDRELVISGCDPPEAFNPLEEVFDHMTFPVSPLGIRERIKAVAARRNANGNSPFMKPSTKSIAVIALVSDQFFKVHAADDLLSHRNICFLSGTENQHLRITPFVDSGVNLRIEAALGSSHVLPLLPASGISPVLMHFDKGGIDKAYLAGKLRHAVRKKFLPESLAAPAIPVLVNGIPPGILGVDSPPATAFT